MPDENVIDIGYAVPEKAKILVVDDETALQTLIHDALESDYRIVAAYNGREAIRKAATVAPDLILMDVMMPDIGGYEAVRLLHDDPATRHIPVVIMTAQHFDESTIQLIKREPNVGGFLTKPFRSQALREIVKATLDKKR